MNESGEKLLNTPLATPELPAEPVFPFLSTAEFINKTPPDELKNITAIPDAKPIAPPVKETSAKETAPATPSARPFVPVSPEIKAQSVKKPWVVFGAIVLCATLIIVAFLYVWGGVLRGTIVLSPAPKFFIK